MFYIHVAYVTVWSADIVHVKSIKSVPVKEKPSIIIDITNA